MMRNNTQFCHQTQGKLYFLTSFHLRIAYDVQNRVELLSFGYPFEFKNLIQLLGLGGT